MSSDSDYVTKLEYPALYTLSSDASKDNQATYKNLTKANLICLVAASFFDVATNYCSLFAYLTCIATILSAVLWLISDKGKSYEFWFDARALTESIKTASWRFAMCAEPYDARYSMKDAERLFLREIADMLDQEKTVYETFDYSKSCIPALECTKSMIAIRELPWERKKAIYLSQRIIDQKDWYSKKSRINERSKQELSNIVIILLIVVIFLAILTALGFIVSFAGAVLTLISSLLTWSQVQQRSLLAHSYGVAAKELTLIEGKFNLVQDSQELAEMVAQAELAMSREHTLWISRNSY